MGSIPIRATIEFNNLPETCQKLKLSKFLKPPKSQKNPDEIIRVVQVILSDDFAEYYNGNVCSKPASCLVQVGIVSKLA